jgi:hypothetical protein
MKANMSTIRRLALCSALVMTPIAIARAAPAPAAWNDGARVVLSAERMFGLTYASAAYPTSGDNNAMSSPLTSLDVSLFGDAVGRNVSPYSFPRLAIDAFVTPQVTVGGSATYFRTTVPAAPDGVSGGTTATLVLAPRVGYVATISPRVSFWPRIGATYVHVDAGVPLYDLQANETILDTFAIGADLPFVFALAPHGAITFGPSIDLGLTGKRVEQIDAPVTTHVQPIDLGLRAGLLIAL